MWWVILIALSAFAQDDLDLSAIKKFEDQLPDYNLRQKSNEEMTQEMQNRRYLPPGRIIKEESIKQSETELGVIQEGSVVVRISDNRPFKISRLIYSRFFRKEDEHGFKYLMNKDGTSTYKISSNYVESIRHELELHEPPLRWTPAPNIVRASYDKKLSILPEASFYGGRVQSDYMKDLFNDKKAGTGYSTQYGIHLFTDWKIPIKVGGVFHYENSHYDLSAGGNVNYSSYSFGPQFKTKDFDSWFGPLRLQVQFRISPFAKAAAHTQNGDVTFNFNSSDLLTSIEHPVKNVLGEFVLGVYFQNQWLNLKNQSEVVSVHATNETNKSLGIILAQVFD